MLSQNEQRQDQIEEQRVVSSRQSSHSSSLSEKFALIIMKKIISKAWGLIKRHQYINSNIQNFSSIKAKGSFSQINRIHFNEGQLLPYEKFKQNSEPQPLYVDSLLPISADIDEENQYKKRLLNSLNKQNTNVNVKRRQIQSKKEEVKYHKLNVAEEEEDKFTNELRRMQEEKFNADQKAKKKLQMELKKEEERNVNKKDKKNKEREEKINFDYEGKIIKVFMDNKGNLVGGTLDPKTGNKTKIIKEAKNDENPTSLDDLRPKKQGKKGTRRDQVEFSDLRSLAESVKVNTGVKYVHGGKTFEEKRKSVSTNVLKKQLSHRKLSKEEYKRLRMLNGNKQDYGQHLRKSGTVQGNLDTLQQRSHSELNLRKSKFSMKSRQTIRINNQELRQKFIEKIHEPKFELGTTENEQESVFQPLKFDMMETFNLDYVKTGGMNRYKDKQKGPNSKETHESTSRLPKISHASIKTPAMPKGRERVKDSIQIVRQIRKRFQQKLRI